MYGELGSVREAVALSPREVLDSAAVLLVQQGYEVTQRTETFVTGVRRKREPLFGHSLRNLTIAVRPLSQDSVEIKLRGNDKEGVQERQGEWFSWAESLPKTNRIHQEYEQEAKRTAKPEPTEIPPEESRSEVTEGEEAGSVPSRTDPNAQPAVKTTGEHEMQVEDAGDRAGTHVQSGKSPGWVTAAPWDRKLSTAAGKQEQETTLLGRAGGADASESAADRERRGTRRDEEILGSMSSRSREQAENTRMDSGMEKHTISVGSDTLGETVAFTANCLGTAVVNGGSWGGGMDFTVYRLPDNTYRALVEREGTKLLVPSNFVETFGTGQPATYWRWTYEEAETDGTYGEMFSKFMEQHPEGRKRDVRDLD